MVESTFMEWFNHFINSVRPSKANPVLLILDNHESHMSINFIDLASDNGVIVLTIPPHSLHKLQPLDITLYGPFKRHYNREIGSWLVSHPGKTVSIYDIAEISGKTWAKVSMPVNIISGFSVSGISPFQPDRWKDEDFFLSQVTNRPNPETLNINPVSLEIIRPNPEALNINPVSVEINRPNPEALNINPVSRTSRKKSSNSKTLKFPLMTYNNDEADDILVERNDNGVKDSLNFCGGITSNYDLCAICEEMGRDNEVWYRCRQCASWAHKACTSIDNASQYVCDYCNLII
nr:uncharacterized protein LOC105851035 [Hydra vulgaris]